MKYYHATSNSNFHSILDAGEIKPGYDGIVYLADSAENAIKFIALRCFTETINIFEIDGLDESKVEETFDHSESFFQCKAYGYPDPIPLTLVHNIYASTPKWGDKEDADEESK